MKRLLLFLSILTLFSTLNAQVKISALPSYSAAISTDVIPIVDVTTATTKKITYANFLATAAVLRSTNLAGGVQYNIPYQSSTNTTAFISVPTNSTVLSFTSGGAFSWLGYASTNTVSNLVQRDASGNFSAGAITATQLNLNGNLVQTGNYSLYNTYSSGWAGAGYKLDYGSSFSGKSFLEVDYLSVRGTMNVYELLLNQVRGDNGNMFVSSAAKVASVGSGTITFEDPSGNNITPFATNDLILCQVWDGAGTQIRLVQATVTSVSGTTANVTYNTGTAQKGDTFVRVGNTSTSARQASVYLSSTDANAPFIDMLSGVNSWSAWAASTKTKLRLGNLGGITDVNFPGMAGYGLYADNVYLKGNLYATSGTFTGSITSSATITGGVFQTASSGQRIVLNESSGNTIKMYSSTGDAVTLYSKNSDVTGNNSASFNKEVTTSLGFTTGTSSSQNLTLQSNEISMTNSTVLFRIGATGIPTRMWNATFDSPGSSNTFLTWDGSKFTWSSTITTATNLAGGASASLPYQTASGTTSFLAAPTNDGTVWTLNNTSNVFNYIKATSLAENGTYVTRNGSGQSDFKIARLGTAGPAGTSGMLYFFDANSIYNTVFVPNTLTGNRAIAIPNGSGTLPLLEINQTFSGTVEFTGGVTLNSTTTLSSSTLFDASSGYLKLPSSGGSNANALYYDGTDVRFQTYPGNFILAKATDAAMLANNNVLTGSIAFTPDNFSYNITLDMTGVRFATAGGSGSGTTSTLSNGVNGQEIILMNTSSSFTWTLNETGNINLQGSADYVMGQYDTITLVYYTSASKWIELSRSNN